MSQNVALNLNLVEVYPQQYLDHIIAQVNSSIYSVYHPNCNDEKNKKNRSSAANFVSRVLLICGMICKPQIQIRILIQEMIACGWIEHNKFGIEDLIPGDVVVWEQDKSGNRHIGFVHENNLAVSFYGKKGYPILHELGFEDLLHGHNREIISRLTLVK